MSDALFRINIWFLSSNKHGRHDVTFWNPSATETYTILSWCYLECPPKVQVGRKEDGHFGRRFFVYWKILPKASMSSEQSRQLLSLGFLSLHKEALCSTLDKLTCNQALPRFTQKPLASYTAECSCIEKDLKGKDVRSRGAFKDPAQAQGSIANSGTIWMRTLDEGGIAKARLGPTCGAWRDLLWTPRLRW